jgi:hypothetical protein
MPFLSSALLGHEDFFQCQRTCAHECVSQIGWAEGYAAAFEDGENVLSIFAGVWEGRRHISFTCWIVVVQTERIRCPLYCSLYGLGGAVALQYCVNVIRLCEAQAASRKH